jgi:molecular chaperone IbpA
MTIDNFFVGFDEFLFNNKRPSYPPYNILKESDTKFKLELAVAGYSKDNLELYQNNNILTIKASKIDNTGVTYIHQGISKKLIDISFTLAPDMVVDNVKLEQGILTIYLNRLIPEQNKPKLIPIL